MLNLLKTNRLFSLILWGTPGCGKTTLARLIATKTNAAFIEISAVTSGVKDIKEAILANKILHRELKPCCVEFAEGKVQIPSPAFNALFIAFHAMQHYGSGLALHHLCDWVVILKHYGLLISEEMKKTRFYHAVVVLTNLCNEYLGTNVPVERSEELASEMMQEIMHPEYDVVVPAKSKVGIIIYKTRRFLHRHKLNSKVFDQSLIRRIFDSIVSHIRQPETIFG